MVAIRQEKVRLWILAKKVYEMEVGL